ncbi:MAG: hypothetical protein ACRCZJ_09730 [Erysipelotrichaceae bacterium]
MKIQICGACSGIDAYDIKQANPNAEIEEGCLGYCGGFDGKKFAVINDELVVEADKVALLARCK